MSHTSVMWQVKKNLIEKGIIICREFKEDLCKYGFNEAGEKKINPQSNG